MEKQLLGNYLAKMFKQQTKLILETFQFLCNIVGPSLGRVDSCMKSCIPIETWVAIALFHLSNGYTLQICGEIYGVVESTTSINVGDFCATIKKHLKPLMVEGLTTSSIRKMVDEFEELQGMPYVFGVVDGSYISIVAPP